MDPCARKELEHWKNTIPHLNSRCFADAVCRQSRIVYSDANAVGCAAFIAIDDIPVSHKNWDSLHMKQNSTWRELHCFSSFKEFCTSSFRVHINAAQHLYVPLLSLRRDSPP